MTLETRLVKLERRCRLLTGMLLALGGMLCLAAAAPPHAAKPPEELTVRRLAVVDSAGRKRILLDAKRAGGSALALADPAGNIRVTLAATETDAGLLLFDTKRRNRIALNTDDAGQGNLLLTDTAGQQRVELYTRDMLGGITLRGAPQDPALVLMNTGTHGLVGYGDITRDEGFLLGYNYQKRSGILKVGEQRVVTTD